MIFGVSAREFFSNTKFIYMCESVYIGRKHIVNMKLFRQL